VSLQLWWAIGCLVWHTYFSILQQISNHGRNHDRLGLYMRMSLVHIVVLAKAQRCGCGAITGTKIICCGGKSGRRQKKKWWRENPKRANTYKRSANANKEPPPLCWGRLVRISGRQRLAFIVDLVGFFLPVSFSPGGCTRAEDFMVTLTIDKDDPWSGS